MLNRSKPEKVAWEEAKAFSRESGRDAAISELTAFEDATDKLFYR